VPSSGAANYRNGIRSAVRGLWSGAFTYSQFFDAMDTTIRAGIPQAVYEGAAECDILPAELTPEETAMMRSAIFSEINSIGGFADVIIAGSKANGGKLAPLMSRAELWVNRYLDVMNRAKLLACGNQKLKWVLGPTKKHCSSCSKLAGKVKRANYWRDRGIQPQNPPNPFLECDGWNCLCQLVPTDEPLSRGPLPSLP
jgi:hypothetical protein